MQVSGSGIKSQAPIIFRHMIGLIPKSINPFFEIKNSSRNSIVKDFDYWDTDRKQQFVFKAVKQNVEHAYAKIPFYHDYYDKNHFRPADLKSFGDIRTIPIINKKLLSEYPIHQRGFFIEGAVTNNTGGSSGHTLAFYTDKNVRKVNEAKHMIIIWEKIGYRNSDLKLVLNGQNRVENDVDFCVQTNSLRLDVYREFSKTTEKLKKIATNLPIRFLHGYPSIIYEFALFCDGFDHELRDILRKSLKGAFLGSEYPHSKLRDKIENVFCIDTVNWYGHTEAAILAWEKREKFRYYPFQTYGFAEITDDGHLVGSSFYDKATPFIRYDTEDVISDAEIKDGFLISFGIKEGRSGEYVTDKNGKNISLTALIFGRHHKLFDYCSHIQVCQKEKGKAQVLFVPIEKGIELSPEKLFDSSNIEIEFSFRKLENPVRTKSGKLNLLINQVQLETK
jgi:phenylacetate-CoA ligase